MSLDNAPQLQQTTPTAELPKRRYPFEDPKIQAKAKRRAKAWRKANPQEWAAINERNRQRALAKRAKKEAKKQAAKPAGAHTRTLNVSVETFERFSAFRNNAVSVSQAVNMLLDLAGDKKIVAKATAVTYTVE